MSLLNVNGKVTRIDQPAAASADGDLAWTTGTAIDVDVTIDEPTRQQQWSLGATIAGVTAVIYVMQDELPAGQAIAEGARVVANQEDEASVTYVVARSRHRVFEGMSHFELFCKVIG